MVGRLRWRTAGSYLDRDSAGRRTIASGVALLAVLGSTGSVLAVQSADARPGGWLGVRLNESYECVWEDSEEWKVCDLKLDITEVKAGGPAATGGLRPGDRMIAINGQDLTFATWDGLRESIRVGTPVSIDFMRSGDRHFVRVTPVGRGRTGSGRWVRGRIVNRVVVGGGPSVVVVTLTELDRREGGGAFAITLRNTDDNTVEVEPAALRVVGGQLRLAPLNESLFLELPELRREIAGSLQGISASSYERANIAVAAMANIRARLPSDAEFREKLTRIAQVGLEEIRLATGFRRSYAGAEFEEAGRDLASAVDAKREGLLVLRVVRGSPAYDLGLRPGDVVVEADGRPIRSVRDLDGAVTAAAGRLIEVMWMRRGTTHSDMFPKPPR